MDKSIQQNNLDKSIQQNNLDKSIQQNNDYQIFDVFSTFDKLPQSAKKCDESGKSRPKCSWKRCILAVSMVVLITAASVFAAFFFINILSPQLILRKERRIDVSDLRIREEVVVGENENYATYEIRNANDAPSHVYIDSNREIQIYKTSINGENVCLISPIFVIAGSDTTGGNQRNGSLNTTDGYHGNDSFRKLPNPVSASNASKSEPRVNRLVKSSRAIEDRNILGASGRLLCSGVQMYWAQRIEGKHLDHPPLQLSTSLTDSPINPGDSSTLQSAIDTPTQFRNPAESTKSHNDRNPTDPTEYRNYQNPTDSGKSRNDKNSDGTSVNTMARKKRAATKTYYSCYFDFNNCYYFTFPDDYFEFQYFTCSVVCSWSDY